MVMDIAFLKDERAIRLGAFFRLYRACSCGSLCPQKGIADLQAPAVVCQSRTIVALNPLSVFLLFPILPVGLALFASEHNWGLLNQLALPEWLKVIAAVVLLDLVVYTQHVLFHAIPTLWRLHMMHHADLDIDMTTGLRFHPIEIVISMAIKLSAIAALGAPPLAVLIFEVALNATSMFNHGNISIPQRIDRILRLIVVTPDMHRVHHSVIIRETNSNYGFNFALVGSPVRHL
jgi:sterol desaturase/sphingolipid hydroxylase (fatty acid hydroxylase superfamily)